MHAGTEDDVRVVGEDVWLTVPPLSEFLRTVRLVAADAAGRAGLDYDEIEDFRIAVDELCHLLMTATNHDVSLTFGVVGSSVVARGRAWTGTGLPPLSALSQSIVESVADHHDLSERDDEIGFSVMKESRSAVTR
jgi:hypothetical protein